MASIVIGAVAAPISYYCIKFIKRSRLDESLDVWGCHGMAGVWGALATGIFANPEINALGTGLLYGNPGQLTTQLITVVVSAGFAFIMTFVIAKVLDLVWGLSVSHEEEELGLDISEHGERAYALDSV